MTLISNCCGAQAKDDMYYDTCPKCGEPCIFLKDDELTSKQEDLILARENE